MPPLPHTLIHKSMRLIARGLAAGRLKTVASGVERIPTEGPALIVARHYHHLYDGLALFAAIPRSFHIVVTLDWVSNRPMGFLMQTLTRIARWPVLLRSDALERGTTSGVELFSQKDVPRYQRNALREAGDLLVERRIVVVFPEGYPNVDSHYTPKIKADEFLPFKPGFVNIALRAEKRLQRQIPIIPAGLRYTRGAPWVAYLNIGEPVHRKDFKHARELITHLEKSVRRLSTVETSEASRNQ
jgi:1-acyl-sn-glycerol-3-phosphate acyltransferase